MCRTVGEMSMSVKAKGTVGEMSVGEMSVEDRLRCLTRNLGCINASFKSENEFPYNSADCCYYLDLFICHVSDFGDFFVSNIS